MKATGHRLYIPDDYTGVTLAANASTYVIRQESSEHVYTNDRGWRVERPGMKAAPAEVAVIGCSWPMGCGVEYERSFPYRLQVMTGRSVANLGVGSYSLVQAIRRLEREIAFIRPKVIMVSFSSWMVARCFKYNAFNRVLLRPIFVRNRKTGEPELFEMRNPPGWMADAFLHAVRERRKGRADWLRTLCLLNSGCLSLKLRRTVPSFRRVDIVQNNLEPVNLATGRQVTAWCFRRLKELADAAAARVLVCHHFEYFGIGRKNEAGEDMPRLAAAYAQIARQVVSELDPVAETLQYESPDAMQKKVKNYLGARGLRVREFVPAIHFAEHNHPNDAGHQLIAEFFAEALTRRGW